MPRLLLPPELEWLPDGTPVSRQSGDVYFSAGEGLAESRAVFLAGCGLPERWQGRDRFTIAETGFGTGLNFLAAWQLWRASRPSSRSWLHFVSFEGFPLLPQDARRALSAWPELAGLARHLLAVWPAPVPGVRQVRFADDGVTLTLHLGDIAETLPASVIEADAWFLDGFSPAKNPAMWSNALLAAIAARAAPGARIASYTVAGEVRRGLAAAGFEVAKAPGYGRKRERLEGVLGRPPAQRPDPFAIGAPQPAIRRVAILGAGIAGAAAARALIEVGLEAVVFDPAATPAAGASGNPLALVMPRLDVGKTTEAALLIDAYLTARAAWASLPGTDLVDVRQEPRGDADRKRFAALLKDPPLPPEDLEALAGGGLLHKHALILRPAQLISSLLEGIEVRLGGEVDTDLHSRRVNGASFDALILASGPALRRAAAWLRLETKLGQVDYLSGLAEVPPSAIAAGTYAIAAGAERLWGATFAVANAEEPPIISAAASAANFLALKQLSPWWIAEAQAGRPAARAGLRATTPDRLPLIGALPDGAAASGVFAPLAKGISVEADLPIIDGVFIAGGFGSRGFTWAPWAAAILAARLAGAPAPASRAALAAVSPARQIFRRLKRGDRLT